MIILDFRHTHKYIHVDTSKIKTTEKTELQQQIRN